MTQVQGLRRPIKVKTKGREKLTEAEYKVGVLTSLGMTSREIATRLYISDATLRKYRHSLMVKTGTRTVNELIAYLIAYDLVKADYVRKHFSKRKGMWITGPSAEFTEADMKNLRDRLELPS